MENPQENTQIHHETSVPSHTPTSQALYIVIALMFSCITGVSMYILGLNQGRSESRPVSAPSDINEDPLRKQPNDSIACPEDARICPDGSTVVRVAPDCEFQVCPLYLQDDVIEKSRLIMSEVDGYSLEIPSDWSQMIVASVDSRDSQEEYLSHMVLFSEKNGQSSGVNAITIPFLFDKEKELSTYYVDNQNPVNAKSITSEYLTVNGYNAVAVTMLNLDSIDGVTENSDGYLVGGGTKSIYVDLENGKILRFDATWSQEFSQLQQFLDEIIQTLVVTQ